MASADEYDASLLVDPAVAVKELLRGFKRCTVQLGRTLNQAETHAKLAVKRLGIVTHYLEPAAFRRAFWAKRANNNMTTRPDAARNLPDIGSALIWRGKTMKYRAVRPEVVCFDSPPDEHYYGVSPPTLATAASPL